VRGLPNFCFTPSGGFASAGVTAASREQPRETLRGSVLRARPLANPRAPLCPQGTQTVHKLEEEGDRLGRGGGTAATGEAEPGTRMDSWVGGCSGSTGRASTVERLHPTSPRCWLRGSGAAGPPGNPKGLRSGGTNRDGARQMEQGSCQGSGGAPRPALGLAECSGLGTSPAVSPGMGGTGRFGGALGWDAALTQARAGGLVPAVSCLWPAAKPCHRNSLHFRAAENRHPLF